MERKLWILAVITVAILNLVDAFITMYAVAKGVEEGNPLMKLALDNSFFLQFKILTSILICSCCLKIDQSIVKIVIAIMLLAYSIIIAYHLYSLKIL